MMEPRTFEEAIDFLYRVTKFKVYLVIMGKYDELEQQNRELKEADIQAMQAVLSPELNELETELEKLLADSLSPEELEQIRAGVMEQYQRRVADMLQHELHPSRLARFIDKQRVFCLVCKDWFAGGRKAWTKYSAIRTTLDLPDVTAKRLLRELCETDGLLERYRDYYYPTEGGAQLWAGWQGIVMDPLPVQRVPQTRLTDDPDIAELAEHIATIDQTPRTYPLYAHDLNLALRELFIVQIVGESLHAESIRDGDLLLVERFSGERPADGRLVLAGVRTPKATHTVIRHYHHDPTTGMVELRPSAPQHVSLYAAEEDVLIFGTPLRVIRELE